MDVARNEGVLALLLSATQELDEREDEEVGQVGLVLDWWSTLVTDESCVEFSTGSQLVSAPAWCFDCHASSLRDILPSPRLNVCFCRPRSMRFSRSDFTDVTQDTTPV